jgi:hypothetical protein
VTIDPLGATFGAAALLVGYFAYRRHKSSARKQALEADEERRKAELERQAAQAERARREKLSLGCSVREELGDYVLLVVSAQNSGNRSADDVYWTLLTPLEPRGLVVECVPHAGQTRPEIVRIGERVFQQLSTKLEGAVHASGALNFATVQLHKPTLREHPCDLLWRFTSAAGTFPPNRDFGGIRVRVPAGTNGITYVVFEP